MNLNLRAVEEREEFLALGDLLDQAAQDSTREFMDSQAGAGAAGRFVGRHFGQAETLLVVAEAEGESSPWGLCVTGPLEDPWTGDRRALVLALWVEPRIRHRGVARALVREVRTLLTQRGVEGLAMRAAHNDDALISMGERWGFVRSWELLQR